MSMLAAPTGAQCLKLGLLAQRRAPSLPIEIIDYVVAFMLLDSPVFSTIEGFSCASHRFRHIAFRQYFSLLTVKSKSHWLKLCQIPGVRTWTRTMDTISIALYVNPENLVTFMNLHTVTIDFDAEGQHTHHTSAKLILSCMPPQVTRLELLYLPSITTYLLSLVATYCPRLDTLVLRCSDRLLPDCCWNCYDEAGSHTVHSPIPNSYCNAEHLAHAFGKELKHLHKLRHLHLGIYLSPLDLFYDHLEHAGDFRFPPTPDVTPPFGPDLCGDCQVFADEVRRTELVAAATLASHLPMLETMTWSTFFAQSGRAGDDQAKQTTTIAILQEE
ncbi:uncharacterized protein PHACADRAFT_200465 [Phanerochaete carnosa HHB-10118-sp]|uniref:F-box domain-containing protein n=1 Tax=Phanerochaete carnosa (strain HHB-10118-sp) TaxID=650164 RepID=K5VVC0_PHACS|nr:uncharacterized protein PHACADRAFT_200465 [Phanerochaete carnosa HHB-10118-sp]EKM50519.1 hypothetical protein PHACADRAFT_200465 [Phanerochaete carnosa HHB-10118-sp]